MTKQVRSVTVQLLRCAADLAIQGEPFAVLEAQRRLGLDASGEACRAARAALDQVAGPHTELSLLEAAVLVEGGWSPA
jgi:hypothetical protein